MIDPWIIHWRNFLLLAVMQKALDDKYPRGYASGVWYGPGTGEFTFLLPSGRPVTVDSLESAQAGTETAWTGVATCQCVYRTIEDPNSPRRRQQPFEAPEDPRRFCSALPPAKPE